MHASRPYLHMQQSKFRALAGHGKEPETSRRIWMEAAGALGRNALSLGLGFLVLEEVGRGFMRR